MEPDGKYPLIGDSSADRAAVEYRKAANRLNGHRAFLDAGYFVVSRTKRYFATMAGFHNGSHKHADELSFELFDRDTRVITGPGKYGYDRDDASRLRALQLRPQRPHRGQEAVAARRKRRLRERDRSLGGGGTGWFAALGRNPLLERQGVSHSRLFVFHPLVGLFILDNIDSRSGNHEYRRYLQFGEDVKVERDNKRGLDLSSNGDFDGCVRDEAQAAVGSNLRLDKGKTNPYEGYTFPKTGQGVPRWTATYRSKASDVSHLIGIGLQRGCPFSVQRVAGAGLLDFVLDSRRPQDRPRLGHAVRFHPERDRGPGRLAPRRPRITATSALFGDALVRNTAFRLKFPHPPT